MLAPYLQLIERESAAGPDFPVILDRRASHNRPQLVDWSGSERRSLRTACEPTADLLAGLQSPVSARVSGLD